MTAARTASRDQYNAATTDARQRLGALTDHHAANAVSTGNPWLTEQLDGRHARKAVHEQR